MALLSLRRFLTGRTASRLVLITTSLSALLVCPHSKVEESFNLQATHDLYYYGLNKGLFNADVTTSNSLPYDHLQYPGVVPRTFAGPLLLAGICRCISFLLRPFYVLSDHPMFVQFLARFLLLSTNLHAWFRLQDVVIVTFGSMAGNLLLLITASQFHLPFYASRMLPNVFALVLVIHSYAYWLSGNTKRAAANLVVATVVFRCDVVLLLFTVGVAWIVTRKLTLPQAIYIGLVTAMLSLTITVPLDSLLWQRWTWPEGEVFYFNTVLNKSSEWGTSPWYWYFVKGIPRAMLFTLLLVPLGVLRIPENVVWKTRRSTDPKRQSTMRPPLVDTNVLQYFLPILAYVGLYSFLAHKEMRFIFPALPMLNVMAAAGLQRLCRVAYPAKDHGSSGVMARLAFMAGVVAMVGTCMASFVFLLVSRHNYPGGTALKLLEQHLEMNGYNNADTIRVYVDVASSMTGVSLFGQAAVAPMEFVKAGYEEEHEIKDYMRFTHMLVETKVMPGFHLVAVAQGHPRLDIRRAQIVTEDAIYVLERN